MAWYIVKHKNKFTLTLEHLHSTSLKFRSVAMIVMLTCKEIFHTGFVGAFMV
jgi:hypothetical protein